MFKVDDLTDFVRELAPLVIAVLAYLKSERASHRSKLALMQCTRADCPLKPENQSVAEKGK